ncbi:MAG: peptidylprolyl isomerase [Ferruginibacter sp.]
MLKNLLLAGCLFILYSCNNKKYEEPHIIIETAFGDIEAELYPAKAPKTTAAFHSFIQAGYYKNSSFYRVLKADEMPNDFNTGIIQGGTWPVKQPVKGIEHESTRETGLSHTNGIISLARTDIGTATTEFFICIGDQSSLDAGRPGRADSLGFAAFGKVTKGMDIVRKIQAQQSEGDHFTNPIRIDKVRML